MTLVCHRHLSRAGGGEFTPPLRRGDRLIFFMDDVMYFLLGSVKEPYAGFISVLFPAGKAEATPQTLRIPQKEMLTLKLRQLELEPRPKNSEYLFAAVMLRCSQIRETSFFPSFL